MGILLTLFLLWLAFTLLDLAISGLALHFGGAREIGLLFSLCDSFQMMCFIKGAAAFLFGIILVDYKQKALLAISCALYLILCAWNGGVLLKCLELR